MRPGIEKLGLSHQTTTQSQRMNIHINARLTLRSRAALVSAMIDQRLTAKEAGDATVEEIEKEMEKGQVVYQIEAKKDGTKIEFNVDNDGKIVEKDSRPG